MNYLIPRPEGFIVDEIPGVYVKGDCTHFTLKKTGWNTRDAIYEIARLLHVNVERFGFAGLKDKNAITTQRVSAWRIPAKRLESLKIKDIELSNFKEGLERIKLGSHQGNHFRIVLEGVSARDLRKPINVPNLFGIQRFGGNELLGKALIDSDWKKAVDLLIVKKGKVENQVSDYVRNNPNEYLNALRRIDKSLRVLWINAYQSMLWNNQVKELINSKSFPKSLPLQSFPEIKGMPELGEFPGGERDVLMNVKDYKITQSNNNSPMPAVADSSALTRVVIEFSLPNGSYATTLIDFVTDNL